MTLTIKPAKKEDMHDVFRMISDMADGLGEEKYLVNTEEQTVEDWGKYECMIAVDESGQLMGYLAFSYFYLSWQGHSIYLDDVYVDGQYRRQEVATHLMDALFERAAEEKIKCVRWYVLKDNEAAINFYKKYGVSFEENRYRCNYFVNLE